MQHEARQKYSVSITSWSWRWHFRVNWEASLLGTVDVCRSDRQMHQLSALRRNMLVCGTRWMLGQAQSKVLLSVQDAGVAAIVTSSSNVQGAQSGVEGGCGLGMRC